MLINRQTDSMSAVVNKISSLRDFTGGKHRSVTEMTKSGA